MFSCVWAHVCTNMWRAKVDEVRSLIEPEACLFQLFWPASLPAIHKVCTSDSQHISLALYGSWRIYYIPHPCMSSTLSAEPNPRSFSLLCYCMCICFYLHVCLCNMCTQWLWRPEENMWFPWNQSYRWLSAPIWVLRIGSSQATRALNHWVISHHTASMIF